MGATADKIKGKAMQVEGKLTGDRVRMAQGTAKKAKGDIEGAASRAARKVKRGVRRVKSRVKAAIARRDH
jgi:uncharacterized protein YjbJ (UPF0337 family)